MDNWTVYNNSSYNILENICDTSALIISVATLIVCIIGFYGNILSVVIYTKRSMKSTINVLLTVLSFVDLFLLVTCVPVFILPNMLDYFRMLHVQYSSIVVLYLYPLTMSAQTSSVWIFIVISFERYLAVCQPFKAYRFATIRKTKRVVLIVILGAFLYNLVRFWEYSRTVESEYEVYISSLRSNTHYLIFYYTVLYLVTHFMMPFLVIILLNYHILKTIKQSFNDRVRIIAKQNFAQFRTCRMIIMVTCTFALSNCLAFILNLWEATNPDIFTHESVSSYSAFILLDLSNFCVVFNSSVNFVFYLVYCKRYRQYFYNINHHLFGIKVRRTDLNITGTEAKATYSPHPGRFYRTQFETYVVN